uniref:Putative ribose-5-phosphate isomerase 3ic n=1 Tax=Rhizophora mucronata TaxID=61149 RepID=A0A2P2IR39_RHIMU
MVVEDGKTNSQRAGLLFCAF